MLRNSHFLVLLVVKLNSRCPPKALAHLVVNLNSKCKAPNNHCFNSNLNLRQWMLNFLKPKPLLVCLVINIERKKPPKKRRSHQSALSLVSSSAAKIRPNSSIIHNHLSLCQRPKCRVWQPSVSWAGKLKPSISKKWTPMFSWLS